MPPWLSLVLGIAAAAIGGELFLKGVVGVASWARVPAGIIGATVAAFATSSPEVAVAVQATLAGAPQIALGDALGSNVVNIGLVLGLVLLFGPIQAADGSLRRDLPVALLAPVATGLLLLDGSFSLVDAGILCVGFLAWLIATTVAAFRERSAAAEVAGEARHGMAVLYCILGLVALVLAGNLIVTGAKWVGGLLGWEPFVVGATLVAFGTSAPELATSIISRLRGHDEVGLGTVIGSNIFNGLFIVALTGLNGAYQVSLETVITGLGFGLATVIAAWPSKTGQLAKSRGGILLALYAASVILLLVTNQG